MENIKMKNGKQKMKNGTWKMENEKWKKELGLYGGNAVVKTIQQNEIEILELWIHFFKKPLVEIWLATSF